MASYQSANGSTGKIKDNEFVPFTSQAEADSSLQPSPFASLSEPVQTSLADAGITTVESAKALKLEGLVALPEIGEATAKKILAL